MLVIDGAEGEGGGQIVRSALSLSLLTGTPFQMNNIRAKRTKPGLQRQHLTAVRAAAEVGQAQTTGAELNSRSLVFEPGEVKPGNYYFPIGTAGSTTLVLETVLPVLMKANAASTVILEGGTHNNMAPPLDFLEKTFLPILQKLGPRVSIQLERPGFYPRGGGKYQVNITPAERLKRLELMQRGKILETRAYAMVSKLPLHIAERELKVIAHKLKLKNKHLHAIEETRAVGPGNVAWVEVDSESLTEVISGVGELGVTAENVAKRIVRETERYLKSEVPVGEHLADQLLLPLSLGSGGTYLTSQPSDHTVTNRDVIRKFLNVEIEFEPVTESSWKIDVRV